MILKLFKNKRKLLNDLQYRFKHTNHPGHKKKQLANPIKYSLPDKINSEIIYPPVKPKYPPGDWPENYDTNLAWKYFEDGEKYKSLKTIQERMTILAYSNIQQTIDDLNIKRTRHFPIYSISGLLKSPKMLDFIQYITKTQLIDNLSDNLELSDKINENLFNKIKNNLKETILININKKKYIKENYSDLKHPGDYRLRVIRENEIKNENNLEDSNSLIKDILDSITTSLSVNIADSHLTNALYGNNVNIKAYWKRCGYKNHALRGCVNPDNDVIRFQFDDIATYQIKTDKPLKPIYDLNKSECYNFILPACKYSPSSFKVFADHVLPKQIPGHWYGDKREFNYLTAYNITKTFNSLKSKFNQNIDTLKVLDSIAAALGHAELTAQAYYLGFSMWNDLTYPLLGQFLFTNGKYFSIAKYQLNTLRLWNHQNKLNNLMHITKPECLFELNEKNNDFLEFNENLLKKILNILTNKPIKKDDEIVEKYSALNYVIGGTSLRPYLSIQNFEEQLNKRHKLFATSLYELVKYDKPANYLNLRDENQPINNRPKFARLYDKYTYEFRDIVLNYFPRDFYGPKLIERMLKKTPKQTEKFWDSKTPVYEWTGIPPSDTNNIPRNINLSKY